MTTPRDPDRLIHAFLLEGAEQLQDQVYDEVRAGIEHKRQRVVIGPWRVPTVSKLVPIGLGAAAVIAVLFLGSRFIGSPSSNVGGPASQPPASAAPSAAPASTAPSANSAPPLIESFSSTQHGFSMSYPEGWITRAATEPWTDQPGVPQYGHPGYDVLYDPQTENLFLDITSQPIGDSMPEDWVAASMAGCSTTDPIAVDGATGLIGAQGCHEFAAVTAAGRGYQIQLYTPYSGLGEAPPADFPYDRAWFEEVLATVQLRPEDAVDAASSATPTPVGGTVEFHVDGVPHTTEVTAVADGTSVSGTAVTTTGSGGRHEVRLECAARQGDRWAFVGTTEQTTFPDERAGEWSAVVVEDGTPQQIGIVYSIEKAEGDDCYAKWTDISMADMDISTPVESGELAPPPDLAP